MKIYYVNSELPVLDDMERWLENSIFMAGPTPRSDDVVSWRPRAVKLLREMRFEGAVFIPEMPPESDRTWLGDYDGQVEWEWEALGLASCTLFWVPRDLKDMPAFTTNVEFGFMTAFRPDMVVFGAPEGAPKTRYLASICKKVDRFHRFLGYDDEPLPPIPQASSLQEALKLCMLVARGNRSG